MGKSHERAPVTTGFERATRIGQGFHSDFKGPFTVPTPAGHIYFLTVIDDCSGRVFAWLCKSTSEWLPIWTNFVTRVEAELGRPNCVSWILCDNGGVYISKEMAAFCERKGIQLRHSAPYSQWQNHTAERNMRTIGEMALTTMIHANFPRAAWGWAFMHA